MKSKIEVPWEKIVSTRNLLVHGYFDINLKVTWETAKKDIQELKKEIKKYLRTNP